jgi:hypothetical protein
MLIEAFSRGKDPAHPEANEDRMVVLPGRAYAVIDGVTARVPTLYDGKLSGQYAAELIQRTLERELAGGSRLDGLGLVGLLTDRIAAAHARFGLTEAVREDANPRFAATLALAVVRDAQLEIVLVGDSGVRVNGAAVFQVEKELDGITAALRVAAWQCAARRGSDWLAREQISRSLVRHGTRSCRAGLLTRDDLLAIEAETQACCARQFPAVPAELVLRLIHGGIVGEQKSHQNNGASPLGYSCLDGFPIPAHLIAVHALDLAEVVRLELFTDGYFGQAPGFGVACWEAHFAAIEAEDPAKIGRYKSVKGSIGPVWADDRTYVAVQA